MPFSCDFENEAICAMHQPDDKEGVDRLDWERQSGKSTGRDTGPDRAYSGSWYMYIETTQQRTTSDDAL